MLGLLLAAPSVPALARAPETARRPPPRPGPETVDAILARARLGAELGYVLIHPATGEVLEGRDASAPFPPASVAKTVTALYAWQTLGGGYRFRTRLIATGPVRDGIVQGDIVLAGGGDPMLNTDLLADMAQALRGQGITGATGAFRVWSGALPEIREIDPAQPPQVGYNPAVGGLNLNFNRVQFFWRRNGGTLKTRMEATAERYRPEIGMARIRVVDRAVPPFTYSAGEGIDNWTVAGRALNANGSRWLPVRAPAAYAGEAFRAVAATLGIKLGEPVAVAALPAGQVLVTQESGDLRDVATDMLKFSNNLTAETLGLTATGARGVPAGTLADSAGRMSDWIRGAYGVEGFDLRDHSGLCGESRATPAAFARLLSRESPLPGLLRRYEFDPGFGRKSGPVTVHAKTGRLNFASGLAGYIQMPGGPLIFSIFAADIERRGRISSAERENPPGAIEWAQRARRLQQDLIQRWIALAA